ADVRNTHHLSEETTVKLNRLVPWAAGSILALTLAACSGSGAGGGEVEDKSDVPKEDLVVGVAMPTQSMQRWLDDGNHMKEQLEDEGYTVDLQYAEDDIPTQVSQIENMVTQEVDVLVIEPADRKSTRLNSSHVSISYAV